MARDDDFLLTDEELRLRKRRRRRRTIAVLLAVAIAGGGYFAARPTLDAVKAWQARRHAQKAYALMEQENWTAARTEAVAAYQLRPAEPEALRAIARLLSRVRQADALEFWKRLREVSTLTAADRRDEASIALFAGDVPRGEQAVQELLASSPTAADWLLATQLALQKRSAEDAYAALAKLFEDTTATDREQLQAALLELSAALSAPGTDGETHARDAWSRIEKISAAQTAAGLEALTVMSQQVLSRPAGAVTGVTSTASQLSAALEHHPLARAPQKLLALDLLAHQEPSRRAELIERGIAEFKEADAAGLTTLATWLNGKGEHQRQLDVISLEKALQTRDLFLQHVNALGALGRWADIKQLLENERFPLDQVVQRMYLARCNAQLGETAAAENNWQRAFEAAGGEVGKLMTLADYAEKNGATAIAERAYNAVAAAAPKLRTAQQGRLRAAQASRDARRIQAVLAEMLATWPNDTAVQNDEAYLRLLLHGASHKQPSADDAELAAIEQLASTLVEREPARLPHRTLLALARLKLGHAADALAVYTGINVPTNALTASALAVHSAVLEANGHHDDAATERGQVPVDQLLTEERSLLE